MKLVTRWAIGLLAVCLIQLIPTTFALIQPASAAAAHLASAVEPAAAIEPAVRAVVWSQLQDPYHDLAREIARAEGLPLVDALDAALAHDPEYLIWVVSPEQLSEQVFFDFGAALQRYGKIVSVGLISGSTIDTARALWQRRPDYAGRHLSIVPREGQIEVWDGAEITHPAAVAGSCAGTGTLNAV